jgi:hypothetical protein
MSMGCEWFKGIHSPFSFKLHTFKNLYRIYRPILLCLDSTTSILFYIFYIHRAAEQFFYNKLNLAQFGLLSIADINYPIFWKQFIFFTVVIGAIFFSPLRNNGSIWQYLCCPIYQEFQLKSKIISCDTSFIHTVLTHFGIFEKKPTMINTFLLEKRNRKKKFSIRY